MSRRHWRHSSPSSARPARLRRERYPCHDPGPRAPYAKRTMAADMIALMATPGFDRFHVVGHDRGARVAYRLALDHPDRVRTLSLLDVLPSQRSSSSQAKTVMITDGDGNHIALAAATDPDPRRWKHPSTMESNDSLSHEIRNFQRSVQATAGETVVFPWIEWPDQATRDAAMAKMDEMMKDPRMDPAKNPMPFDGKRMIYGGFVPVVELGGT